MYPEAPKQQQKKILEKMRLDLYVGNLKYAKVKVQFQLLIPLILNLDLDFWSLIFLSIFVLALRPHSGDPLEVNWF